MSLIRAAELGTRHAPGSRPTLTPREVLICARLAEGVQVRHIAAEVGVTPFTMSTLIAEARAKVWAKTREQLVACAFRDRLLGFDRDGRVVPVRDEAAA